jgi:uncharacterized protein YciI
MIIVELTHQKPRAEVEKYLSGHIAFLERHYKQGTFMASGPKEPRDGGIILVQADEATARKIMQEDPLCQHNISEYRFIDFRPAMCKAGCENVFGLNYPFK